MMKRMPCAILIVLLVGCALFAQGAKPVGENSYVGTILSINNETGIYEFTIQDDTGEVMRFYPVENCETILPIGSYRPGDSVEISDYVLVSDNTANIRSMRWITALVSNEWLKSITLQQSADILASQSVLPVISTEDILPDQNTVSVASSADSSRKAGLFSGMNIWLLLLIIVGSLVALAIIVLVIMLICKAVQDRKIGDF